MSSSARGRRPCWHPTSASPCSARYPLVNAVRLGGDEGRPVMAVDPDSETARSFQAIADKLAARASPGLPARTHPTLSREARVGLSPHFKLAMSRALSR